MHLLLEDVNKATVGIRNKLGCMQLQYACGLMTCISNMYCYNIETSEENM
jgi:hypothetical protein